MQTRKGFLGGLTAGVGVALVQGAEAQAPPHPLDRRFGRATSPRVSVSYPRGWFVTDQLTDIGDPIQLFAVANHVIPAPHRNVAGTVNASLIPIEAVLVSALAFKVMPDMAVWAVRTSAAPPQLRLADMPGEARFGGVGLTFHSWSWVGWTYGVQVFVWVGERAPSVDVRTLDAVLGSISFDEPL